MSLDKNELRQQFNKYDRNKDGSIDWQELLQAFNAVEEKKITGAEARDIVAAYDKNKDGTIGFDEFVEALTQHKQQHGGVTDFVGAAKKTKEATVNKISGYSTTAGDVQHSYSDEEKMAFVDWINECLEGDPDLKHKLPISLAGEALFKACQDGILLWYTLSFLL